VAENRTADDARDARPPAIQVSLEQKFEDAVRTWADELAREREAWRRQGRQSSLENRWLAWRTMSSVKDEAKALAEVGGDEAVAYLAARARRGCFREFSIGYGGYYVFPNRLVVLTLAELGSESACRALGESFREGNRVAILAASYAPVERIVPTLRELVDDTDGTPRYERNIRRPAIELLAILGDEAETIELLQASAKAARYGEYAHFRMAQIEKIQVRLAIQDEDHRNEWRREELLYWQCIHDMPHERWGRLTDRGAERHFADGARFSAAFLRSKLPEPFAALMAGWQRETSLIPDLKAIVEAEEPTASQPFAETALEMIGD